jgi:hypothetical protein
MPPPIAFLPLQPATSVFKTGGRKTVKELLRTENGRRQYREEIANFRRIVPDATEAQARAAITSRRRKGEVINYSASPVEKSKFRDEFGKKAVSSNLGQLTKLANKRKEQNERGHGDTETQISADGKTFHRIARDTEKYMSPSQRARLRKLEADFYRDYKIAMGYAA